jgi:FHA domain-containing protein
MHILKNALGKVRKLESTLTRSVDRAARQWSRSGPRGPLEVLHAILGAVEERLEPAGRGAHVFPFNRIKVSILAPSRDTRARFSTVLDEHPPLHERISNRLHQLGCDVHGLHVRMAFVAEPSPEWLTPEFHIDFGRASLTDAPMSQGSSAPELKLTITSGSADKPSYALTLERINLGRCAELRDRRNRLIRTNHVVFKDGAGATNDTVSRRHAHIDYDESTKSFRIADDRSAQGTAIVRNGRTIGVPTGARGVRIQSGDELMLGEARVRVRIADSA